jgi:Aspartyl protease
MFFRCSGSLALALIALPLAQGEPRCPGSVISLPLRQIQGALIVVSVRIDHSEPVDFVVDTGAQISTVDLSLAHELGLKPEGTTGASGVATFSRSEFAHLRAADPRIRGILGDSFLEHFDLLIDNRRHILCLDDTGSMAAAFKGDHISLADPLGSNLDLPFTRPLIITARAEGSPGTLLLRLDSGSNSPVLYLPILRGLNATGESTSHLARVIDGKKQGFQILPPLNLHIGRHTVPGVSFAVPMKSISFGLSVREDGILPTMAFQRVFISSAGHYAAMESW